MDDVIAAYPSTAAGEATLGWTKEALTELATLSRSGWAPDAWLLDADTAFDGIRGDEAP